MSFKNRFSEADLQQIQSAVEQAEKKISGEIVPVFVEQSASYRESYYKAALLGAALAFGILVLMARYFPLQAITEPLLLYLYTFLGGTVGAAMVNYFSGLKKLLTGRKNLERAALQRAEGAFLEEEVFQTRFRTGILIFVSFFERKIIILADKGINSRVEPDVWENLVHHLSIEFKNKRMTEGLISLIEQCGNLLLEKGFIIAPDDINELKDNLRNPD